MKTKIKKLSRIIFSLGIITFIVFAAAYEPTKGKDEMISNAEAKENPDEKDEWLKEAKQKITEPNREMLGKTYREVTMYTSRIGETDKTPCISGAGNLCGQWDKGRKYTLCGIRAFPPGSILKIELRRKKFLQRDFPDGYLICENTDVKKPGLDNSVDIYAGHDGPVCINSVGKAKKGKCLNYDFALEFGSPTLMVTAYEGDGPVYYP